MVAKRDGTWHSSERTSGDEEKKTRSTSTDAGKRRLGKRCKADSILCSGDIRLAPPRPLRTSLPSRALPPLRPAHSRLPYAALASPSRRREQRWPLSHRHRYRRRQHNRRRPSTGVQASSSAGLLLRPMPNPSLRLEALSARDIYQHLRWRHNLAGFSPMTTTATTTITTTSRPCRGGGPFAPVNTRSFGPPRSSRFLP